MSDRWVLISLAIWALLFGLLTVTSVTIEHGKFIMGLAALVLGIICIIKAFR